MTSKQRRWLWTTGGIWLAIGIFLMVKGLLLLSSAYEQAKGGADSFLLTSWLAQWVGSCANAMVMLILVGLSLGVIKGRFALRRTVRRLIGRIDALPPPASLGESLNKVFGWPYLCLVIGMIGLGVVMRALQVPLDVRGLILVGVGSALVRTSRLLFRGLVNRDSERTV